MFSKCGTVLCVLSTDLQITSVQLDSVNCAVTVDNSIDLNRFHRLKIALEPVRAANRQKTGTSVQNVNFERGPAPHGNISVVRLFKH